jgi:hypothetical protein
LMLNADSQSTENVLMDIPEKPPGITPGSAISLLNSRALPTGYLAGVAETQL